MPIANLLSALEERTIARQVGLAHDEARMRYALRANTVADFDQFSDVIGDYYAYHHAQCVSPGGHMSRTEAAGRAKEIIEQEAGKGCQPELSAQPVSLEPPYRPLLTC